MIVQVNEEMIDVNLIMFDSVSLQLYKEGNMVLNMNASDIKKIIVVRK